MRFFASRIFALWFTTVSTTIQFIPRAAAVTPIPTTWNQGIPSPVQYVGSSTACADDLCFVTGGLSEPSAGEGSNDVYTYNLTGNVWSPIGTLPRLNVGRMFHSTMIVWDSSTHYYVFVIGGLTAVDDGESPIYVTSSVEYYDPDYGVWSNGPEIGPFPNKLYCNYQQSQTPGSAKMACAVVNTTIVCSGGQGYWIEPSTKECVVTTLNYTWALDVTYGIPQQWTTLPHLPTPLCLSTMAWIGNRTVMVIGGANGGDCAIDAPNMPQLQRTTKHTNTSKFSVQTIFNNVYLLDLNEPLLGWVSTWSLFNPRAGLGNIVDPYTGFVYAIGGTMVDGGDPSPIATVEVFNPQNISQQWVPSTLLPAPMLYSAYGSRTWFNWSLPSITSTVKNKNNNNLPAGFITQGIYDWYDWYTNNITAVLISSGCSV